MKQIITSTPVLALFNAGAETVVSADASSYGLGAVLLQKQPQSNFKPITYISRSLMTTEQRYAQLEKESLAFTWACERFADYLIGLKFHIHTDHKPLIPLFSTKNLEDLPVCIQRYRLRMIRFHFTISHVPGKQLTIADALSQARSDSPSTTDHTFEQESQTFVNAVIQSLPATEERLQQIKESQQWDTTCIQLKQHCQFGWPEILSKDIQPFRSVAAELSVENELLLKGSRIVAPTELRSEILDKLHEGHLGITKCHARARQSVWWPGISQHLAEKVKNCVECTKNQMQRSEPILPTSLPELPWQKVGTDLFLWKNSHYLIMVDYYSRYIELSKLNQLTAGTIITHTKSLFARHGIPKVVYSDNGPQFSSEAYKQFALTYPFKHITSSPYFPQSNREAEKAVGTIKSLLKKGGDPYLAFLAY